MEFSKFVLEFCESIVGMIDRITRIQPVFIADEAPHFKSFKSGFFIYITMALNLREQYRHPLWDEKRKEILERDNNKCTVCGSSDHRLEVHHLCYLPDLLLWEYDNELMTSVCGKHHEQLNIDLPKVSGLIAFEALKCNIDLSEVLKTLQLLSK